MFPLIVTVLTVIVLLDIYPPIKECRHWLIFVGIRIRFTKFDTNDDLILSIPYTLDYHAPPVSLFPCHSPDGIPI